MTPKQAEQAQNAIYRKMPAGKKLKIAGALFSFGKKLDSLKYGNRETGGAFTPDRKNFK